jgi:hypothetical protein
MRRPPTNAFLTYSSTGGRRDITAQTDCRPKSIWCASRSRVVGLTDCTGSGGSQRRGAGRPARASPWRRTPSRSGRSARVQRGTGPWDTGR